ncbi:unnamed protein product [Boreogadus saida]
MRSWSRYGDKREGLSALGETLEEVLLLVDGDGPGAEHTDEHQGHVTLSHLGHVTLSHLGHVTLSHLGHVTLSHLGHVTLSHLSPLLTWPCFLYIGTQPRRQPSSNRSPFPAGPPNGSVTRVIGFKHQAPWQTLNPPDAAEPPRPGSRPSERRRQDG